MKYFAALAVLILATTTAHAMSAMTNATGPSVVDHVSANMLGGA